MYIVSQALSALHESSQGVKQARLLDPACLIMDYALTTDSHELRDGGVAGSSCSPGRPSCLRIQFYRVYIRELPICFPMDAAGYQQMTWSYFSCRSGGEDLVQRLWRKTRNLCSSTKGPPKLGFTMRGVKLQSSCRHGGSTLDTGTDHEQCNEKYVGIVHEIL